MFELVFVRKVSGKMAMQWPCGATYSRQLLYIYLFSIRLRSPLRTKIDFSDTTDLRSDFRTLPGSTAALHEPFCVK